jgi:lysophospholipase L1-like esterase
MRLLLLLPLACIVACGSESVPSEQLPPAFVGGPSPASSGSSGLPASPPAPVTAVNGGEGEANGPAPALVAPGAPLPSTEAQQGSTADASVPPPDAAPSPASDPPVFPVSEGKPSVYLTGDSTVQTYGAAQAPQQGWGQRIAEFFTDDVIFVNKAIGGRSSKSYIDEGRLDEVLGLIQPGDYLFAQWGINDRYRSDPTRFTDPSTTFKQYLRMYVDGARDRSAIPVLVTPTPRLDFVNGVFMNDFPEYCTAIKELGAETNTVVIDLQTAGLAYYTSIGLDAVQADISLDVLHFKVEGARQMARLVAEGVEQSVLPIGSFVK